MANITVSNTSAVAIDVVSQYVQTYLKNNAVILPTIIDRTSDVVPGAKQVEVGRAGSLSVGAETKVANTPYTGQTLTWTTDDLLLNLHKGVYVEMENIANIQSVVDQEAAILERATEDLTFDLETALYTAMKVVSATTPDHRVAFKSGTTLSLEDITGARKLLNIAKVPMMDRFMIINPEQEEDLLNLDNFRSAEKYGSNTVLMNGEIGLIFGFRVLMTNAVTADEVLFYHRSHCAFARQLAMTWENDRKLQNSSREYLLETIYGLKMLDTGKRAILINATGA
ncbi:MAG TPA: hypothetical protein DCS19_10570 [Flavobacterium sp.]|nr:hypothetical protein [Flavobacterium sp.]